MILAKLGQTFKKFYKLASLFNYTCYLPFIYFKDKVMLTYKFRLILL